MIYLMYTLIGASLAFGYLDFWFYERFDQDDWESYWRFDN